VLVDRAAIVPCVARKSDTMRRASFAQPGAEEAPRIRIGEHVKVEIPRCPWHTPGQQRTFTVLSHED